MCRGKEVLQNICFFIGHRSTYKLSPNLCNVVLNDIRHYNVQHFDTCDINMDSGHFCIKMSRKQCLLHSRAQNHCKVVLNDTMHGYVQHFVTCDRNMRPNASK